MYVYKYLLDINLEIEVLQETQWGEKEKYFTVNEASLF